MSLSVALDVHRGDREMVYLATPTPLLLWTKSLVVLLTGPAWCVDQEGSRLHVSILQSSLPDSEMKRDLRRL